MTDDNRRANAEFVHQRGQRSGLAERRLVSVAALGPAMPRPVDEQQLGAAIEQGPKRHHLIHEVCTGAVDENDGRQLWIGRRGDMHEMHARPVGDGKRADGRVAALDQPGAGPRDTGQHEHQGKQKVDRGGDDVHAFG